MRDMHNLGIFDSLAEVWDSYPYGGYPGDYVMIREGVICWDDERRTWGDSGSDISSDKGQIVERNLTADKNLTIGENIKGDSADFNKLVADTPDIKNLSYALKNHNHGDVYATKEHKYLLEDVIDSGEGVVVPGKIKNARHADVAHDLDKKSPVNERFISKKGDDTTTGLVTFLRGPISEELIEANNSLIVRSGKTLSESQSQISYSLSELGKDSITELGDEDLLSTALLESPVNDGITGTLGGLGNVSNTADAIDTKDVVLVKQKGGILWEMIGIDKMRGKDGVIVYPTVGINIHTGHLILSMPTNNCENQFKVTNGHLIL